MLLRDLLLRVWRLLKEWILPIWKWLLHHITGRSEIERICLSTRLSPLERALRLDQSIQSSSNMEETKRLLLCNEVDLSKVRTCILSEKNIKPSETFLTNLNTALNLLIRPRRLYWSLLSLSKENYDSSNPEHEKELQQLWLLLDGPSYYNNKDISERISSKWGVLGFQGTDPATDFRGMGILGLRNLRVFAEKHNQEARKALLLSHHPQYSFPFAITGINMTATLLKWLEKGVLTQYFLRTECTVEDFHYLYSVLLFNFCSFYQFKVPKDIMDFPRIMNDFSRISEQLFKSSSAYSKLQGPSSSDRLPVISSYFVTSSSAVFIS